MRWTLELRERESAADAAAVAYDGGEFSADRIDLGALAALAAQLPLGATM